ncbi:glycoside hydrolase [Tritrichomonas foetus]|uniref:Glycoside hydrolase n=1 Tax=Tritrichomonas foetus TaxID=1144522 RepID=A0A1J4JXW7_9EUKA|nr:glycoside hydrolase [Tritrichomonas foetus]|eukprot:OHT03296.1 glycoside hydrolase [Tritrichomonas foetus]
MTKQLSIVKSLTHHFRFHITVMLNLLLSLSVIIQSNNKYSEWIHLGFNSTMNMKVDKLWPCGWWMSANVITQVVRYEALTGDRSAVPVLSEPFEAAKNDYEGDFINEFYDDNGWWGHAWYETFLITGDKKYLNMSKSIFNQMTSGWQEDGKCGGLLWKRGATYISAISNGLFNLLGARLYEATGDEFYGKWFKKSINWWFESEMYDESQEMVRDGLNDECGGTGTTYTYNQGMAIGPLIEAYKIFDDKKYLDRAEKIAQSSMINLIKDGALSDHNEAESGDGVAFKGPYIRHLGTLYRITGKHIYRDFIIKNADLILEKDYDSETQSFGVHWYGPFLRKDSSAHACAMECLQEAYSILE